MKHKNLGEDILMPAISDTVSEVVGKHCGKYFHELFQQPPDFLTDQDEFERFTAVVSVMLGKGSPSMLGVYRLIAANQPLVERLKLLANKDYVHINDTLRMWNPQPQETICIFPIVLAASIIRSMNERLILLAEELYTQYGNEWLIPYFSAKLFTNRADNVYDEFAIFLQDEALNRYIHNGLGRIYYDDQIGSHTMSAFWGRYSYGSYDNRTFFKRKLAENLDARWLERLMEHPHLNDKVKFQVYNRSPVIYESYKQMVIDLLPKTIEDVRMRSYLGLSK
ncbi:hypothetical protein [Aneurinibacillus migulanus]|uniref:Uncharacterized protein n=2 Tax=Aneurinibacillus migulanus TaxID=47500 RepID=A0A0D1Y4B4_ANEMI|nr:hypothetical protein [Aneurinibacillus migulanus]KIV54082.1 hypothetical protein TS65_19200 [Aneurinibacillus migulanus]KON97649.1 hypothetical protein AF333_21600 [Aneurinibacillus migulanus]MED0894402.1 hypothetical protein [Aneurinibacillus migulanus]MED1617012.1 hypothetical protein [Aneurinibacillus migulanus]